MKHTFRIELERVSKNLSNRKWRKLHKELIKSTKDIVSENKDASLDMMHQKVLEIVSHVCEDFQVRIPLNFTFIYKEGEKKLFEKKNIIIQELELERPKRK